MKRVVFLLAATICAGCAAAAVAVPDVVSATINAARVFTAVHDAMRQWGSSVHHNGLSFFIVTVPPGNLFYHGCGDPNRRTGLEWLAFEPEHAAPFGSSGRGFPVPLPDNQFDDGGAQHALAPDPGHLGQGPDHGGILKRGYVHTYRAARPLRLLLIDGQSGAKGDLGPIDTQDFLLLYDWEGNDDPVSLGERERAKRMCELPQKRWNGTRIDGFIRMEAGFEIIYCEFGEGGGLDLVSINGSPSDETSNVIAPVTGKFEHIRAVAQRYYGFGPDRANVDFSSMVSALWYPVNLTNEDPKRQDLPRLVNLSIEDRIAIASRLGEVVMTRPHTANSVPWQAVADRIVTLYALRLASLVQPGATISTMRSQINSLINHFIDFSSPLDRQASIASCAARPLEYLVYDRGDWTPEDHFILVAFQTVTHRICDTLFSVWLLLDLEEHEVSAKNDVQELMDWLGWAVWRGCGGRGCGDDVDKICFVSLRQPPRANS